MTTERWLRIELPYACGGVRVDAQGIVVDSAAIFGWMRGKPWQPCMRWVERKGGTWQPLLIDRHH